MLLVLYFLRHSIADWLLLLREWHTDSLFEPIGLTTFIISVAGTPLARAILFGAFACTLATMYVGLRLLSQRWCYWSTLATFAAMATLIFHSTETSPLLAIPGIVLLATNLMPDDLFDRLFRRPRLRTTFVAVAVGIAELFLFRHYAAWIVRLWTGRPFAFSNGLAIALPAILIPSALMSVLIESHYLARVEQALRMPSSARIVDRGDFNWVELDATKKHLFVADRRLGSILRYDVADFSRDPLSSVHTAWAQSFAYDPTAARLYVYNHESRQLLVLDSNTLELKRSIPITDLSIGDTWIAPDRKTNTITIASEADTKDGVPFFVLDLSTGAQLDHTYTL